MNSSHPECDRCVRAAFDGYWCETHDSPIGDSSDGWAGCTTALVADVKALAEEYEAGQKAAEALIETDYPAYEQHMVDSTGLGLRLSNLLLRDEAERAVDAWPLVPALVRPQE